MSWAKQLQALSLKSKIVITVLGAGFAVLGASTYLSFTYWQKEARAIAEQQALLAVTSARLSIENALNRGDQAAAQIALNKLVSTSAVGAARVYDADNRVLLSTIDDEVGMRHAHVWIPAARELPRAGMARVYEADQHAVHAFIPIGSRLQNVLEVELSMGVVEAAMQRGARLGIGLLIISGLLVGLILYAMVQHEVVAPFRAAEQLAEERRVLLEQRAGFAEVGELAAEMAHEFKRPLASIRSAVQLLEQEYTLPDDKGQLLLGRIESQLERLSDTMRDVFGLAKPVGIDAEPVELASALDNALMQVAANAQGARVKIIRDYGTDITITGDARRLELAFTNLFNNAIEAMPDGGSLTVLARRLNGTVVVEIRDTGVGIDPSHLADVIRPFYSTKPTGTGLGLPLVARIIRAHNGDLHIDSTKGVGTTVHVRFDVVQKLEDRSWEARAS